MMRTSVTLEHLRRLVIEQITYAKEALHPLEKEAKMVREGRREEAFARFKGYRQARRELAR